jgi:hypothetical protein
MEAEEEDLDEIEREKEIVDQDDPNPPETKRRNTNASPTNGKAHAAPGNGKTRR